MSEQNTGKQVCIAGEGQCRPCTSGRTCIPGPCETRLAPGRSFLLRLANLTFNDEPAPIDVQVCARRRASQDSWTCTPYEQAADLPEALPTSGMSTRLQVTTADLLRGGGLDISVGQPGAAPLAWFEGTAHHPEVKVTALCRGLRFPPSSSREANPSRAVVSFYLDDP